MSVFSERMCEIVAEKKISWTELSKRTGMSSGRISQYKTGLYTPKPDGLYKIADALGVNPDYLAGKSDYKESWTDYKTLQDLTAFEMRLLNQFQRADENVKEAICLLLGIDTKGRVLKMEFTKYFSESEIEGQ